MEIWAPRISACGLPSGTWGTSEDSAIIVSYASLRYTRAQQSQTSARRRASKPVLGRGGALAESGCRLRQVRTDPTELLPSEFCFSKNFQVAFQKDGHLMTELLGRSLAAVFDFVAGGTRRPWWRRLAESRARRNRLDEKVVAESWRE